MISSTARSQWWFFSCNYFILPETAGVLTINYKFLSTYLLYTFFDKNRLAAKKKDQSQNAIQGQTIHISNPSAPKSNQSNIPTFRIIKSQQHQRFRPKIHQWRKCSSLDLSKWRRTRISDLLGSKSHSNIDKSPYNI